MTGNNAKTFFYHGLWYFVIATIFYAAKTRTILEHFVPDQIFRFLIMGTATIVFSWLFTLLFMKPQGSFGANLASNTTLLVMDIGVLLFILVLYLFKTIALYPMLMAVIFLILQIVVVMAVMSHLEKKQREE